MRWWGDHEHSVLPLCACALLLDVGHVVVECLRGNRKRRRLTVEIDNVAQRQPPVAPSRLYMEIAQQERLVSRHVSGSNVFVGGIRWTMEEDLGAEFSDVEAEHLTAPHRLVAARGGEHPARVAHPHAARFRDAAREVGVFAVSRAMTSPFRGSSTSRIPGMDATAAVRSVLALLMTMIS